MNRDPQPGTPVEYFDENYHATYAPILDGRSEQEVDFLVAHILKSGDVVLDVACGYGRHAAALAKRGFQVVGVDASPTMARLAKERTSSLAPTPMIFKSDIRTFVSPLQPTIALLLFSSAVGYGSEDEDRDILSAIARNLPKGGRFVLDGKNLKPLTLITKEQPETIGFETHWLDGDVWHMVHNHEGKETRLSMRLYDIDAMTRLLVESGFSVTNVYAGFELKPFTGQESRYLLIAQKK